MATINETMGINKMFGKLAAGMCRLSMDGGIAVKTSNGYKSYDIKKKRLVNCDNFVFDIGEEFFFLVPTNRVTMGDIILVNGKPKCVTNNNDNKTIVVLNYEDSTIETILPERHLFMGNVYYYGKIISMFGNNNKLNSSGGMNKMLSFMAMSEMMKTSGGSTNSMMLPFMMMNGNISNMFDGLFDENSTDNETETRGDDE